MLLWSVEAHPCITSRQMLQLLGVVSGRHVTIVHIHIHPSHAREVHRPCPSGHLCLCLCSGLHTPTLYFVRRLVILVILPLAPTLLSQCMKENCGMVPPAGHLCLW